MAIFKVAVLFDPDQDDITHDVSIQMPIEADDEKGAIEKAHKVMESFMKFEIVE